MDPSSSNKPMEKPINHDPHPLKCPRCESSNTKFCYYNNYSLSQPRHFCKACKRYWTRGGTLRTVPVGGGCRKNKRVKRPTPINGDGVGVSIAVTSHVQPQQISLSPVSNQMSSSLFYNTQPTNNLELNFPFPTFSSSGVSSGFDFQQSHMNMNGFGLGFTSGLLSNEAERHERFQDFINQQDRLIMGSNAGSFGSNSTMTSLLASLQHTKSVANGHDTRFKSVYGISNEVEVKMEGEKKSNEYENNNQQVHDDQQLNKSSDANSSILWNTSNIGSWFDPSSNNLGSSVPSLI